MSRDVEFKALLRAYRSGVITQETFECEVAALEGSNGAMANGNGAGFKAFGKTYRSEHDAVVSFIDKVRGEANGGEAFAAWAEVCTTDCIKTGSGWSRNARHIIRRCLRSGLRIWAANSARTSLRWA